MPFDVEHDVFKVSGADKSGSILVALLESFHSILLMEVMKKLAELGVGDEPLLVLAEVELHKGSVHVERQFLVQLGLLHDVDKFVCKLKKKIFTRNVTSRFFLM